MADMVLSGLMKRRFEMSQKRLKAGRLAFGGRFPYIECQEKYLPSLKTLSTFG